MAPFFFFFFFFLTISYSLSESISISGNVTQMHIISQKQQMKLWNLPKLFSFFRGCGIKTEQVLRTQLHCIKSGCSEQLTECGGSEREREREREREKERGLDFDLTKHKSPLMCVCEMCQKGRGDERVTQEKLAAGRRTPLGGTLGWTLLGSFRRMAWPIDRRGTTVLYRQLD